MPNVDRTVSLIHENRTFSGSVATIQRSLRAKLAGGDLEGPVAFLLRVVPYPGEHYQRLVVILDQVKGNKSDRLSKRMNLPGYHRFEVREEITYLIDHLETFIPRAFSLDDGFHPGKPFNPLAGPKLPILRTLLLAGSILLLYVYFFVPPAASESQSEPTPETVPTQELLRRVPASYGENHLEESSSAFLETHSHYLQFASLESLSAAHSEWKRLHGQEHGLKIFHVLVNPTELGEKRYMYRVVKLGFASKEAAQVELSSKAWRQQPFINTIRPIPNCGSSVCIQEHVQPIKQDGISYIQHLE